MNLEARILALDGQPLAEKLTALAALAADAQEEAARSSLPDTARASLIGHLVEVVESDVGGSTERCSVGDLLGLLGDPRVRMPTDNDYWVPLTLRSGDDFEIGRYPVTNLEFAAWVDAGGYDDKSLWTEAGLAWLEGCDDPWPVLAQRADAAKYMIANQPVVGVTLHEALAFANAYSARLPRWYERVFAVRGEEKRPYPWGSPFGEGNANTKEEVLGRPSAVGLYRRDCSPQGVYDLAGNAGEWTSEQAGDEYLLHPGSWDQPSLAAWAKALTSEAAEARGAGLGFRLAR